MIDENIVIQEIEEVIKEFQLLISMKSTLSTLKGSTHYHLKQDESKGLLEVTYWPRHNRLWVDIHKNRSAEWNVEMIKSFSERLADKFSGMVEKRIDSGQFQ